MKTCFKCGLLKDIKEFYKHPQMSDGHLNKCKECNKKDVKNNRDLKIDYYREYDKLRSNLHRRVVARKNYAESTQGKISRRKSRALWIRKNLHKRSAQIIVSNAVRDGRLIRSNVCESCGLLSNKIHGHHDDYAYPMQVRWLCSKCHCKWHKENGPGING